MSFSPPEILLVFICFFVALWNTAVGPSGAVTFAAMATILPAPAVVPIHAAVEAGANVVRSFLLREFADWRFVAAFVFGGVFGFAIGWPVLNMHLFSENGLKMLLGAFILFATWVPLGRFRPEHSGYATLGGAVTSFLTIFVGATTPLVAALIAQRHKDHQKVLSTAAACMLFKHAAKIPLFVLLGFSFASFAELLLCLILATWVGTWFGKRVLVRTSPTLVKSIFKAVVTVLGLKLVAEGGWGWLLLRTL